MIPLLLHVNCPSRTAPAEKRAIEEIAEKDERFVAAVDLCGESRERSKSLLINSYLTRESAVLKRFLAGQKRPSRRSVRMSNSLGHELSNKKSVYLDMSGASHSESKSKPYDLFCSVCCDQYGTDLHSHILRSVIARNSVVSFELHLLKPSMANPKILQMGCHVRALYMITFYSVYSSLFDTVCGQFDAK
jgi:hypothetical protein